MKIVLTNHARFEAQRRDIQVEQIEAVIRDPQQSVASGGERVVLQSKYYDNIVGKEMLLRVFGKRTATGFKVITVYKTSKISKYWQGGRKK